ncbi:MAG: ethanolamine permease [Myxococcota bacterium]|jgi:ethanolamine permease|nr:ethanolamine permease [Myxococcota bacterium]
MSEDSRLRKTLGPFTLWGLGVGYVISGEYFGWNLGLPIGGSYGMLAATVLVTFMYVSFILSYTELACAIPRAGGAFVYCARAFGPLGGCVGGLVQIIEFVFAPPAIAMAVAAYIHQRFGGIPVEGIAVGAYLVFTGLNAWGVRQAALFELTVTLLAVGELLLFCGLTIPSFTWANFSIDPLPNGYSGIFACLPFAIWFYLAIEGVANAAEETRNPQRNVALGFGTAMFTLVILALAVFFSATGVAGWEKIVYPVPGAEASDAPLPLALALVVGSDSVWYTLLLGVGLLGLIASFHGIIFAAGRATFEFGRSGFAPKILARIHSSSGTPRIALAVNLVAGVIAILSGKTADIITLACFGAVSLYILSMTALIRLRKIERDLPRPFKAVGYPYLAILALGLASLCFVSLFYYNPKIGFLFTGLVSLGLVYYALRGRHQLITDWAK